MCARAEVKLCTSRECLYYGKIHDKPTWREGRRRRELLLLLPPKGLALAAVVLQELVLALVVTLKKKKNSILKRRKKKRKTNYCCAAQVLSIYTLTEGFEHTHSAVSSIPCPSLPTT